MDRRLGHHDLIDGPPGFVRRLEDWWPGSDPDHTDYEALLACATDPSHEQIRNRISVRYADQDVSQWREPEFETLKTCLGSEPEAQLAELLIDLVERYVFGEFLNFEHDVNRGYINGKVILTPHTSACLKYLCQDFYRLIFALLEIGPSLVSEQVVRLAQAMGNSVEAVRQRPLFSLNYDRFFDFFTKCGDQFDDRAGDALKVMFERINNSEFLVTHSTPDKARGFADFGVWLGVERENCRIWAASENREQQYGKVREIAGDIAGDLMRETAHCIVDNKIFVARRGFIDTLQITPMLEQLSPVQRSEVMFACLRLHYFFLKCGDAVRGSWPQTQFASFGRDDKYEFSKFRKMKDAAKIVLDLFRLTIKRKLEISDQMASDLLALMTLRGSAGETLRSVSLLKYVEQHFHAGTASPDLREAVGRTADWLSETNFFDRRYRAFKAAALLRLQALLAAATPSGQRCDDVDDVPTPEFRDEVRFPPSTKILDHYGDLSDLRKVRIRHRRLVERALDWDADPRAGLQREFDKASEIAKTSEKGISDPRVTEITRQFRAPGSFETPFRYHNDLSTLLRRMNCLATLPAPVSQIWPDWHNHSHLLANKGVPSKKWLDTALALLEPLSEGVLVETILHVLKGAGGCRHNMASHQAVRGMIFICSRKPYPQLAEAIAQYVQEEGLLIEKTLNERLANTCIWTLGQMPGEVAKPILERFLYQCRFPSLQMRINAAIGRRVENG